MDMRVPCGWFTIGINQQHKQVNAELTTPMILIIVAFAVLSIVLLLACHLSRAADIRSRNYPAILDPSHDSFMKEEQMLTASFDPHKLADWAEKCTKMLLPRQDVEFVAFIQSVTLCAILAGLYGVDPGTLSLPDVAFMTNALNCRSDRASSLSVTKLAAMMGHIYRWIMGERTPRALEIIFPAYESMWRLAAVTFHYANRDQHMRNAFLDFSENPTENQFRVFKVKDTKPSVEAIMNEVLRLHRLIMHKNRHPWWKQLFYSPEEMGSIQPESFDAMRFRPKQPGEYIAISFGFGGLGYIADEWVLMTTALVVAKVIDEVDDVNFTLAGNAFNSTSTGQDTRTWVIQKKGTHPHSPPPPYINLDSGNR